MAWHASLYDGPGMLNPLQPDRLGEALVAQVVRGQDYPADLLGKVLALTSDRQVQARS